MTHNDTCTSVLRAKGFAPVADTAGTWTRRDERERTTLIVVLTLGVRGTCALVDGRVDGVGSVVVSTLCTSGPTLEQTIDMVIVDTQALYEASDLVRADAARWKAA